MGPPFASQAHVLMEVNTMKLRKGAAPEGIISPELGANNPPLPGLTYRRPKGTNGQRA